MPTRDDLEEGLQVLLSETDFATGLEELDKADLIDVILKLNHAAKKRERWLNDLFQALGPEVAGLLPENVAVGTHSITKAVKTLRAQRDEARVQAKKLTGKDVGNLGIIDRLADTASVILQQLETYQKEVNNHEPVSHLMDGVRELLAYISEHEKDETFRAQKKPRPRAKHIGTQDFRRVADSELAAPPDPLVQVPNVADLEKFLEEVQKKHAEQLIKELTPLFLRKSGTPNDLDLELDKNGDLQPAKVSDDALKERIRRALLTPKTPVDVDFGTGLHPGTFATGLDPARGPDATGVLHMTKEEFEELQTVANSSALPMAAGQDIQYLHSLVQAVQDAKPGSSLSNTLALAAGDDKKKPPLPLAGISSLQDDMKTLGLIKPSHVGDAIAAGITPMLADDANTKLSILKKREPRDDDPVIEMAWDGADEEDAVEPESEAEDDEQLF